MTTPTATYRIGDMTNAEIGEFIARTMGEHIEILKAPERMNITDDLVRNSPLIEMFILMPGDFLYRVDTVHEPFPCDCAVRTLRLMRGRTYETTRVEKPKSTWTEGKGHPKVKVLAQ